MKDAEILLGRKKKTEGFFGLRLSAKKGLRDFFGNAEKTTIYTRVQVKRVYKSNPIFEAKNTTFLEKVWFFSFHQLNKINRWSGIQG